MERTAANRIPLQINEKRNARTTTIMIMTDIRLKLSLAPASLLESLAVT